MRSDKKQLRHRTTYSNVDKYSSRIRCGPRPQSPPPSYSDPFCFWSSPPLPVVFSGKLSWGVRMLSGQAVMTRWYPNSSQSLSWMEGLLNLVLHHNTCCWRMFSNLRYFRTCGNTKGTEQLLTWLMLSLFFGLQSGASPVWWRIVISVEEGTWPDWIIKGCNDSTSLGLHNGNPHPQFSHNQACCYTWLPHHRLSAPNLTQKNHVSPSLKTEFISRPDPYA